MLPFLKVSFVVLNATGTTELRLLDSFRCPAERDCPSPMNNHKGAKDLWFEMGQMFPQSTLPGGGGRGVLLHQLCALAGLMLEECLKKACVKTDSFAFVHCLLPVTMACELLSLMWSVKCFLLKTNQL